MLTSQIYKVCELTSTHINASNICKLTSKHLWTDFYTFANWLETFVKQSLAKWLIWKQPTFLLACSLLHKSTKIKEKKLMLVCGREVLEWVAWKVRNTSLQELPMVCWHHFSPEFLLRSTSLKHRLTVPWNMHKLEHASIRASGIKGENYTLGPLPWTEAISTKKSSGHY